jgi:hypothetical protein
LKKIVGKYSVSYFPQPASRTNCWIVSNYISASQQLPAFGSQQPEFLFFISRR